MPKRPKQQRSYLPKHVHRRYFTRNKTPMRRHHMSLITHSGDSSSRPYAKESYKLQINMKWVSLQHKKLTIQFLKEINRLFTKSLPFLPSGIRKNSCSYRPAEIKSATCMPQRQKNTTER